MHRGFPGGTAIKKKLPANAGDAGDTGEEGLILGLGRSPGGRSGNKLRYSGLENPMDGAVSGVAKSRTQLSDFHFHF